MCLSRESIDSIVKYEFIMKKIILSILACISFPLYAVINVIEVECLQEASHDYQELKKEALSALNLSLDIPLYNIHLSYFGAGSGINTASSNKEPIILIDEEKLKNVPLGLKRQTLYHEASHIACGDCEKLHEIESHSIHNTTDAISIIDKYKLAFFYLFPFFCYGKLGLIKGLLFHIASGTCGNLSTTMYQKTIKNFYYNIYSIRSAETLADKQSIELLECEQCVEEIAHWLSENNSTIQLQMRYILAGYLTSKQIRALGAKHKGKICKYHQK